MITVPAHRVKQFGVEFFQASFSAKDIDRLVKFEVLGYAGAAAPPAKAKRSNRHVDPERGHSSSPHAAKAQLADAHSGR